MLSPAERRRIPRTCKLLTGVRTAHLLTAAATIILLFYSLN